MSHISAETGELESLGRNKFSGQIHDDLLYSAGEISSALLNVGIFGQNDVSGPKIAGIYDEARNKLSDKIADTADQVDAVGKALTEIARHYDKIDSSYGN